MARCLAEGLLLAWVILVLVVVGTVWPLAESASPAWVLDALGLVVPLVPVGVVVKVWLHPGYEGRTLRMPFPPEVSPRRRKVGRLIPFMK